MGISLKPYPQCNSLTKQNVFPSLSVPHREIVNNHEKENALNIVTDERTYQVFAESPEDARYGDTKVFDLCIWPWSQITNLVFPHREGRHDANE